MLYLASDHRGFNLKEAIKEYLQEKKIKFQDLGNHHFNPEDDYPDFGLLVAKKVADNPEKNRGILICGSGVGMDIVANRLKGVRSVLAWDEVVARRSRQEDDTNILTLPADFVTKESACQILQSWLETEFLGKEKYLRRLKKIDNLS